MWREWMNILSGWSTMAIIGRLAIATVMGTIIGIDRGLKRRGAGIKTHALVCLGSALVMLTSQYMMIQFDHQADLARLGAQVISGVGFLGVGTILVTEKQRIKGLTTAAGLWTCACVGLAIGIGFVEGAVYALIFIALVLRILNRFDLFLQKHAKVFDLYLELEDGKSIEFFLQKMRDHNVKTEIIETRKMQDPWKYASMVISLEMDRFGKRADLIKEIRELDYVHYVEEM